MRKFILIAGIVLASATAQAGEPRSLSLAGSDVTAAAAPAAAPADATRTAQAPAVADAPPATEVPKYVERPTLVEPKTAPAQAEQPKAAPSNAEPAKPEKTAKADKPRKKRYWNEARIINELHRHGVYW